MYEQMEKREKDAESLAKQRLRDKNLINRDLIDFAHPDENIHVKAQNGSRFGGARGSSQLSEDDVAEEIIDKKAILKEMQMKRK